MTMELIKESLADSDNKHYQNLKSNEMELVAAMIYWELSHTSSPVVQYEQRLNYSQAF